MKCVVRIVSLVVGLLLCSTSSFAAFVFQCGVTPSPNNGQAALQITVTVVCPASGIQQGSFLSTHIDFGDGNAMDLATSSATVSHTYDRSGSFAIAVLATYSDGSAAPGPSNPRPTISVTPLPTAPAPSAGEIYIAGTAGTIERRKPDGTLVQVLYIGHNDTIGGLALDQNGTLYVTDASAALDSASPNALYSIDQNGNASPFGNDSTAANSLSFARHGNLFTGSAAGPQIIQHASNGTVLTTFTPAIDAGSVNWIDLASDQCTMYYTYGPAVVKRFDVCAAVDAPDFAATQVRVAHDLRIRSNGQVVLAGGNEVLLLNNDGTVALQLGVGLSPSFNALALDPDGTSVWVGDQTGQVFHFDLNTGAQIGQTIVTNFSSVHGLAVVGEQRAGTLGPNCSLSVAPNPGVAFIAISANGTCTNASSATLDFGDGTPVEDAASATHAYASAGTYTITLTGKDTNGLTDIATQSVTIQANQPPSCRLTVNPTSGPAPLQVTATGVCSDPEQDIVSTTLDFGDGTALLNSASGTHTYASSGTYTVTLKATDAASNISSVTQTVSVAVNQPPSCTLSVVPISGFAPLGVTVTGSCTDPEQALASTLLDFGDGTTQTSPSGTHTYAKAGTFTVTLTGTDSVGQKGTATQIVTVSLNTAPTCTLTVAPTNGQIPLLITATGACTDAEQNIQTVVLDFGDGTSVNASTGSHTYAQPGTFTVKLTATDTLGLSGSASQTVTASSFPTGIFVGIEGGTVMQFATDGTLLRSMSTGLGGTVSGMAFDKSGILYATDFTAGNTSKFDPKTGTLVGTFGSGFNCQPETIVFDGAGNAYVGQQGCSRSILKFDPSGKLLATYQGKTEEQGNDDVDLSADQCTLLYTSEGPTVFRYDVCKNQQLTPFATGLKKALTLRILPDGGAIVADLSDIVRLNSSGQTVMTYTPGGEQCLYAVTLDPDGTSFWVGDYCSSNIYRFDIASGKQLTKFNTGTPSGSVFGIAIAGTGLNVAGLGNAGNVSASPSSATLASGQSATFTVSFTANSASAGKTLALSCAGLPAGLSCSFAPSSITLGAAGTTTTATLTITRTTTAALFHSGSTWALATWIGVVPAIVLAGWRPRKRRSSLLWLGMIVVGVGLSSSCGGGGQGISQSTTAQATPQGTYNVIVVGSGVGLQSSTTVTVTVQ